MSYAVENALFQWRHGERRLRESNDPALDRTVEALLEELRKRLGSRFTVGELADFYARDTDWALDLVQRYVPGRDAADTVDAAFARYAREASDFAGGKPLATSD